MKDEPFLEMLETLLNMPSFQPFTFVLLNGSRYEVDHRKAVFIENGQCLFTRLGGTPIIFDSESVCEVIYGLNAQTA